MTRGRRPGAPTFYDVLEVDGDASADDVRRAYRTRAYQLHPDRNGRPDAEEAMRRVNEAWNVLGNPERRRRYDASLRGEPDESDDGTDGTGDRATPGYEATPGEDDGIWLSPRRARVPLTAIVLLILFLIVVFTAYAGPRR